MIQVYTGQCMKLPGAISEGKTIEELKTNMTEAIELVLESLEERAKKRQKTCYRNFKLSLRNHNWQEVLKKYSFEERISFMQL